ncbi:MAG: DUF3168 domain-containing protein [Pseudomonadota bacterium]
MTSPSLELQGLLVQTLKADAAVNALVSGAVYDRIPKDAPMPYIQIGATDETPLDASCFVYSEHTVQLDVFSREFGQVECKRITDAIKRALHYADLSLNDNSIGDVRVDSIRYLTDPDGVTTHGIVNIKTIVEER